LYSVDKKASSLKRLTILRTHKEGYMKKILSLVVIMTLAITISVFANGSNDSTAEETIVLKLGHGHTADHSYQKGMEQAKAYLEEKSGGRISMQFYPSAQLGNERQMQEQLSVGTLDATITGLVNLYDPAFALFDFPFLYDNRDQIKAVMYSELMDEMNKAVIAKGMRILGLMEVGFRNVTSNVPVDSVDVLGGFKIRTPESPAQIETFKALGATPTPMSFSELYTALQQGVVDGQENPLENIYNGKLYEVQNYVNVTHHIFNFAYVLISEQTWQQLSSEDQELVKAAFKHGSLWQMDWAEQNEANYEQKLKDEGMTFIYPDRDEFREGAQAAYESDFVMDLGPRAQEILAEIRNIVASVK
jgi:tripartite ATP-independent transporter DctP family solute receptor